MHSGGNDAMTNFQYDNEYASDYQLQICTFHSDGGVTTVECGSQLPSGQNTLAGTDAFVAVHNSYTSALSFEFQTCKFDSDGMPAIITPEEFSRINRWVNRKESHRFKMEQSGYENIYFLGRFNIKAITVNHAVYGVQFTFLSDYPYGFADEIVQTYSGTQFMVYNHSDEIGILLPVTTIKCKEAGNLRIANSMDNEIFELTNCFANETITIDNKNMIITSDNETHKLCDCFNFNYIKLCNTYEERRNCFSSSIDIDITFRYSPVRKVGLK